MKTLCLSLLVVTLSATTLFAAGDVVYTLNEDWSNPAASGWTLNGWSTKALETTDPGGNHAFVNVADDFGVTGQWIFAEEQTGTEFSATVTLSGVPAFDNVSIDRLILGAGGGIDGDQLDGVSVSINGTEIFNANLHGRNSADARWNDSYGGLVPAAILSTVATTDNNGSEFFSERTDGWGHDTLYDAGLDPNLKDIPLSGAGDVTVVVAGRLTNGSGGMEGNPDEEIGVANMSIAFAAIPEPSSLLLLGGSAFGLMVLRRRRR